MYPVPTPHPCRTRIVSDLREPVSVGPGRAQNAFHRLPGSGGAVIGRRGDRDHLERAVSPHRWGSSLTEEDLLDLGGAPGRVPSAVLLAPRPFFQIGPWKLDCETRGPCTR